MHFALHNSLREVLNYSLKILVSDGYIRKKYPSCVLSNRQSGVELAGSKSRQLYRMFMARVQLSLDKVDMIANTCR